MTAMATDIESVIFAALEHELTPPCELYDPVHGDCDSPAEWVFHRACCGSHSLGCTVCRDRRMANLMAVECPSCLHIFENSTEAYMLIEPLNKRPGQ